MSGSSDMLISDSSAKHLTTDLVNEKPSCGDAFTRWRVSLIFTHAQINQKCASCSPAKAVTNPRVKKS